MTQQYHCWAYTLRKPDLKVTRAPQYLSQHGLYTKSYHIAILASDFLFRNKVYQSRLVPLSAPSLPSTPPCSEITTILKLFLYPSCWHFYSFKTHIFINDTKSCFMGFKIYINAIRLLVIWSIVFSIFSINVMFSGSISADPHSSY